MESQAPGRIVTNLMAQNVLKMTDEHATAVQEELFTFLEGLEIKREARATRGYDILLFRKLHKN